MEILGAPLYGVLLLAFGAYLFGAIPTAYLAVRIRRGEDIRRIGSGNVGGANAIQAMGRVAGLTVMAFDVFVKGPLPVIVAGVILDHGKGVEVIAGCAALIGHNWSVFLRFSGGRGLGTGSGVMFAMAWPIWFIFAGIGLVYWLITRNSPVGWVIALVLLPFIVAGFGLAQEYVIYAALFAVISGIKRVASNPGDRRAIPEKPPEISGRKPEAASRLHIYWNRLIYDRDIKDREAWLRGDPGR
jgi:glycerol-3-phosphate acyltransferase PlsY